RSGQEETDSPDDAEWRDRYPVRAHGTGGAAVHAEETGGAPDAGTAGAGGGEAQEEATQVLPAVDPESVHEFPAPKPAPRRFGTALPAGPLRNAHRWSAGSTPPVPGPARGSRCCCAGSVGGHGMDMRDAATGSGAGSPHCRRSPPVTMITGRRGIPE